MNGTKIDLHPHYDLIRKEFINDIKGDVFHFVHKNLKTPIIAIKNEDSNKTFCISFRTIPKDSTGVAHILEHTVLSGSRKYPLKDVFNELTKGGLSTFLNAMTGPDTTYYPFATRNLQEYFNLMDVYLDTTLFPNLNKYSFMQEGWRYELENKDSEIKLKGVVYNEMKGVYSNPLSQAWYNLFKQLMPESTYSHVSGGNPKNIPDLSWEKLKQFHQKFYHPSNALITLYGNAPLKDELDYIENNFFHLFKYQVPDNSINFGKSNTEFKSIKKTYSINKGEDSSQKTFLTLGIPVSTADKVIENLALKILGELLYSSEASPLKLAFNNSNIGKDIEGGLINHIHTSFMLTEVIGSEENKKDELVTLHNDILNKIVKNGFDKQLLLSELNSYEFHKQEEQFNSQRGLSLSQTIISATKLNIDLFDSLKYSEQFKKVREKILNNRYLENLIQNKLLKQDNAIFLILSPLAGKSELEKKELIKKHTKIKLAMDKKQIKALIKDTSEFKDFHQKENTQEEINSLPRLSRKDLPKSAESFYSEKITICDFVPYFRNDIFTGNIINVSIGFDTSSLPKELLPYLEIFGNILTEIGTKNMDYIQFSIIKDQILGSFNHKINIFNKLKNRNSYRPILWLNLKMLEKYIPQAMQLVEDVINNVCFKNQKRIQEILERNFAWLENYIQSEGYNLPVHRLQSYIHESGWYKEQILGLTAYQKLKYLVNNYSSKKQILINKLKKIKQLLFNKRNIILSITGSGESLKIAEYESAKIINNISNNKFAKQSFDIPDLINNEAFITSSEIVFAVQGGDMMNAGINHSGSFEVLNTWINRSFLHKRVRAEGGAYGCFSMMDPLLGFNCYVSYRDPNLESTFKAYEEIPDQVDSLQINDKELEQLIVRTYGNFDPLLNPFSKALRGRNRAISLIPKSHFIKLNNEIKNTTVDQMRAHAEVFSNFFNNSYKTVIGNKEKIRSSEHLFDAIIEV